MRGQTELPALAIAFLFLTVVLLLGVTAAGMAFSTAERPALERQAATSLSEQLVAEDAPVTVRANVANETTLRALNGSALTEAYGLSSEKSATVQLDGEPLVDDDTVTDGTTIERVILLEHRERQTIEPSFDDSLSVTIPRRTTTATVSLSPPAETTVRSVRANDRTVLKNESGLDGTFELSLTSLETTTLWFETAGSLPSGSVEITYEATETQKATLGVTVDE